MIHKEIWSRHFNNKTMNYDKRNIESDPENTNRGAKHIVHAIIFIVIAVGIIEGVSWLSQPDEWNTTGQSNYIVPTNDAVFVEYNVEWDYSILADSLKTIWYSKNSFVNNLFVDKEKIQQIYNNEIMNRTNQVHYRLAKRVGEYSAMELFESKMPYKILSEIIFQEINEKKINIVRVDVMFDDKFMDHLEKLRKQKIKIKEAEEAVKSAQMIKELSKKGVDAETLTQMLILRELSKIKMPVVITSTN